MTWGCRVNTVSGERVPEGVKHVDGGWVGFRRVPGGVSVAFGDLRFGVGVAGVPQHDDGLRHEGEGDAALNCFLDAVLGFADAGDVFPVVEPAKNTLGYFGADIGNLLQIFQGKIFIKIYQFFDFDFVVGLNFLSQ